MEGVKRVAIRVDASTEMGMGHLMRCLGLARGLADNGAAILFALRSHAAGLAGLVEREGHLVRLLADPANRPDGALTDGTGHAHWLPTSWQHDAEQTMQAVDDFGSVDWLIVDHYALDSRWENNLRGKVSRILAVDDIADRDHDCDLLLDQNLVLDMDQRYNGRVPPACKTLLGPRYALLRAEFAERRKMLPPRSGKVDRIFLCFGGSDPGNETAKALAAIGSLARPTLAVDVVIGLSNPYAESILESCSDMPQATLHRGAGNVAELMVAADLAIGAGGIMSWERCCLGLPTVTVEIADNQTDALTALAGCGAVAHLGSASAVTADQLASTVRALLDDPIRTRAMGEAAKAIADGLGTSRVVEAMSSLSRASPDGR